jgi:hypothetical protein
VIVTGGGPEPALAAKAATSTISIVFFTGADPVKFGLVPRYSRPGSISLAMTESPSAARESDSNLVPPKARRAQLAAARACMRA